MVGICDSLGTLYATVSKIQSANILDILNAPCYASEVTKYLIMLFTPLKYYILRQIGGWNKGPSLYYVRA